MKILRRPLAEIGVLLICLGAAPPTSKNTPLFDKEDHIYINPKNPNSLKNKIIKPKKLALVLFYISSCPYCQNFVTTYKKLIKKYKNKPISIKVIQFNDFRNIRENQKVLMNDHYNLKVDIFPSLAFFKSGKLDQPLLKGEIKREYDNLVAEIDKYLAKN